MEIEAFTGSEYRPQTKVDGVSNLFEESCHWDSKLYIVDWPEQYFQSHRFLADNPLT